MEPDEPELDEPEPDEPEPDEPEPDEPEPEVLEAAEPPVLEEESDDFDDSAGLDEDSAGPEEARESLR